MVVLGIGLEIYLRTYWGFCDSVLMQADNDYEYIAQPNQQRFRFRNHINYNSLSMRSEEVDTTATIVLGFGDSVINGGVMVDQDSTATYRLTKQLSKDLNKKVQVLNISAGSWGPDNDFAYLKKHGDFKAQAIFLVVSSHDAYDNMDFKPIIDKVRRYESRQYFSAIWELVDKYGIPRLMHISDDEMNIINKEASVFNVGFQQFYEYCTAKKIPFFIYLNPQKSELVEKYWDKNGKEIIRFCQERNIQIIDGSKTTLPNDYRGSVHLNNQGQAHLAAAILPHLKKDLQAKQ